MQVRPLHLTDAHAVALVVARADARRLGRPLPTALVHLSGPDGPGRWARLLTSAGTVTLGAFEAGRLASAVIVAPMRADSGRGDVVPEWAHVALVVSDPDHWGRGLASKLLFHLDVVLAEEGYHHLELWTQRDNLRARRFYERRGWTRSRRLPAISGRGEPLVHYQRVVPPHLWRLARSSAR
ncbi:MAG: GNAT family N-acetyltransferase [Acidimicrobiales bacterium]